MQHTGCRLALSIVLLLTVAGCAVPFDRPTEDSSPEKSPDGNAIFNQSLRQHGGDRLAELNDLSVGLTGEWPFLIKRIQPLVTDFEYRVDSQERLIVNEGVYTALYTGPAGTKKVVRDREKIRVFYNDEESLDPQVLQSTAMTADAFFVFLLGPLGLAQHAGQFTRLDDMRENGNDYYRIYAELEPGFGLAERDEMILWVDQDTMLTHRINITLEGYESTKGAHVDVTFLAFEDKDGFQLPVKFHERVLGPIRIKAHDWQLVGLDINRGYGFDAVDGTGWAGAALDDAESYSVAE